MILIVNHLWYQAFSSVHFRCGWDEIKEKRKENNVTSTIGKRVKKKKDSMGLRGHMRIIGYQLKATIHHLD